MYVGKLVCEDRSNRSLVVDIARQVHEDGVGSDIGILGRMNPREILFLDEDFATCRRQRSEGEKALKVLTGRGMVEVDGDILENVVASRCRN